MNGNHPLGSRADLFGPQTFLKSPRRIGSHAHTMEGQISMPSRRATSLAFFRRIVFAGASPRSHEPTASPVRTVNGGVKMRLGLLATRV